MTFRNSSGFNLPPLSFPYANSSSNFSNTYSTGNSHIDPGVGFLPPPRARTPSLLSAPSQSSFFNTSLPPSSTSSSTTNFLPDRSGAFSVPPPLSTVNANAPSSGLTARMTVCMPCRKSHIKCGKGMRPCAQCIKRGKIEECLEGVPPEQAKMFLNFYYDKVAKEKGLPPPVRSSTPAPMNDVTLFPLSSSLGASSSASSSNPSSSLFPQVSDNLAYPSLGQLDDMPPRLPVTIVMGKDLCIGRASRDALRTFGYHPHEMVNQKLVNYIPITEREKWKIFSGRMFSPATPAGGTLPATPVELARLPMEELTKPVGGMRSISSQFHWRQHSREMMLVRIELWYGCFFGATSMVFSTFDKAIIIARVTPLQSNALPSASRLPPPSFSSLDSSSLSYPSVLLPPAAVTSSPEQFAAPRRSRTPSISSRGSVTLASSPSTFGSNLPPLSPVQFSNTPAQFSNALPPLPPLGDYSMTPRKRRTSNVFPTTEEMYDHGSNGLSSNARPRLRSPSPLLTHRRSVSSDAGQSLSSSDESLISPGYGPVSFQALQRPPSRNRLPSQASLPIQVYSGAVPHVPQIFPDSSSAGYGFPVRNPHPSGLPYWKTRKYSYIAIDDSGPPLPPLQVLERPRTPSTSSRQNAVSFASNSDPTASTNRWSAVLPLSDTFELLSLDSNNSPPSSRGSPAPYSRY